MSRGKTGKREIGEVCKGPLASKIDLFLTDMARNGFGGTVLIAEGDDVVLNRFDYKAIYSNSNPSA